MSIKVEVLRKYIREIIKQELDEASVTGNIDGGEGPPKTPYAFSGKRKKDKDKEKRIATNSTGYSKVSEAKFHVRTQMGSVIVDASGKGEAIMKVAKALKKGRKDIVSVNRVGVSKAKQVDKKLENVKEHTVSFTKDEMEKMHNDGKVVKADPDGKEHTYVYKESVSVNEGKYHDYKNDESLTPKQKIGYSMREVRDKLNELDKLVKMNVRLKNEIGVDSTSYWKRTHTAMKKISERLVKLANKVGQLY
jgi:hypothetical protein